MVGLQPKKASKTFGIFNWKHWHGDVHLDDGHKAGSESKTKDPSLRNMSLAVHSSPWVMGPCTAVWDRNHALLSAGTISEVSPPTAIARCAAGLVFALPTLHLMECTGTGAGTCTGTGTGFSMARCRLGLLNCSAAHIPSDRPYSSLGCHQLCSVALPALHQADRSSHPQSMTLPQPFEDTEDYP